MKYAEAEAFLFSLPRFAVSGTEAYVPGLQRIDALLERMGEPQENYESILVGGTNGKGSTASMIASISTEAGYRTGLHTSPHLVHFGERMRVDGIPAPEKWLAGAINRFQSDFRDVGASFFEASVALSLLHFAESRVELAVVEVGLGGRLDATNILDPVLSIITGVALDHTEILGETRVEIAAEKGGIMRRERPLLVGTTDPAVNMKLGEMADRIGAEFHLLSAEIDLPPAKDRKLYVDTMRERFGPLELSLEGSHHIRHAGLAIRAAELISRPFPKLRAAVGRGLKNVFRNTGLRARMELISEHPHVWVDVAHNPQAIAAALDLRQTAARLGTSPRLTGIVIGLQKDKDVDTIGQELRVADVPVAVVGMPQPRAMAAEELGAKLSDMGIEVEAVHVGIEEALRTHLRSPDQDGPDQALLVLGSHILVADALSWFQKFGG